MGHGTPLSEGERFGETPGPFMLDVGISSTRRIASFWGIGGVRPTEGRVPKASNKSEIGQSSRQPVQAKTSIFEGASAGVQKTIEDALRTAGLIR